MKETRGVDRKVLDGMTGITEALLRNGLLSTTDAERENELRADVGARRLKLDRTTFNQDAITPTPDLTPELIRALREREGASQAVLAMHLGIATSTLSQWERGIRRPDGPALRLLHLIQKHGLTYVR